MRENCTFRLSGGRRRALQWAPPPTRYSEDGRAGHMGKRSAVVELFLGDMGSIQRELRPSMLREDQLTMETKLEQIAVKARSEPNLRFTSLAHHITRDRVLENLSKIPKRSARRWRRRRRASRAG